jgi:hypothetical protein
VRSKRSYYVSPRGFVFFCAVVFIASLEVEPLSAVGVVEILRGDVVECSVATSLLLFLIERGMRGLKNELNVFLREASYFSERSHNRLMFVQVHSLTRVVSH